MGKHHDNGDGVPLDDQLIQQWGVNGIETDGGRPLRACHEGHESSTVEQLLAIIRQQQADNARQQRTIAQLAGMLESERADNRTLRQRVEQLQKQVDYLAPKDPEKAARLATPANIQVAVKPFASYINPLDDSLKRMEQSVETMIDKKEMKIYDNKVVIMNRKIVQFVCHLLACMTPKKRESFEQQHSKEIGKLAEHMSKHVFFGEGNRPPYRKTPYMLRDSVVKAVRKLSSGKRKSTT